MFFDFEVTFIDFLFCLVSPYLAISVVGELPDPGGSNVLVTLTGKGLFCGMSPMNLSPKDSITKQINASDLGGSFLFLSGRDNCGGYDYFELISHRIFNKNQRISKRPGVAKECG